MATIGSIVDGGRALVVGIVPGRTGSTQTVITRPLVAQSTAQRSATAQRSTAAPTDASAALGPGQLSPADKRVVAELQERDREVRNEENRHKTAAGKYAGEPQYTYRRGPDGKLYVVEGKVPIHVDVTGTAQERTAALRRVQAAAVSVQSPSGGDFAAVASAATAITAQENKGQDQAGQDRPGSADPHRRTEAEQAYRARQGAAADGAGDPARQALDLLA